MSFLRNERTRVTKNLYIPDSEKGKKGDKTPNCALTPDPNASGPPERRDSSSRSRLDGEPPPQNDILSVFPARGSCMTVCQYAPWPGHEHSHIAVKTYFAPPWHTQPAYSPERFPYRSFSGPGDLSQGVNQVAYGVGTRGRHDCHEKPPGGRRSPAFGVRRPGGAFPVGGQVRQDQEIVKAGT